MRNLGEKHRRGHLSKWVADTEEDTTTNEGAEIHGRGLNGGTDDHDDETNGDGDPAAETICDEGHKGNGADGGDLVGGADDTELAALGVSKALFPGREVLD